MIKEKDKVIMNAEAFRFGALEGEMYRVGLWHATRMMQRERDRDRQSERNRERERERESGEK